MICKNELLIVNSLSLSIFYIEKLHVMIHDAENSRLTAKQIHYSQYKLDYGQFRMVSNF